MCSYAILLWEINEQKMLHDVISLLLDISDVLCAALFVTLSDLCALVEIWALLTVHHK